MKNILLTAFLFAAIGAEAANVTLAWDKSIDPRVVGYNIYEGGVTHSYTNLVNAGDNNSITISNLIVGRVYFFAATCYYITGLESQFSTEISYTVPASGTAPAFTLQPVGGTNNYGTSKTLTANAGTNAVYQWLFSGQPIAGATTTSLTFSFLTGTNTGTYALKASNTFGVTVSSPATITVLPPVVTNVRVTSP